MNIRLYFDRLYQPFSAPARITVSNFEDKIRDGSDLPISCEVSVSGSWSKSWTEVPSNERADHLCFALYKLASQQLRARDALNPKIDQDDCVRMKIPGLITLELKKNVIASSEFWFLSLEFRRGGTSEKLGWDQLRTLQPFPYEDLLRQAIVRFMRAEAMMKVKHGLKETARFENLELALKVTGERFHAADVAVTSYEPRSAAS